MRFLYSLNVMTDLKMFKYTAHFYHSSLIKDVNVKIVSVVNFEIHDDKENDCLKNVREKFKFNKLIRFC